MYHRSDWPEAGMSSGWLPVRPDGAPTGPAGAGAWSLESRAGDLAVRWSASRNAFESALYGFEMWELRVEAGADLPRPSALEALGAHLRSRVAAVLASLPAPIDYLYAKVVAGEPLHGALAGAGFEQVEHRRLYRTPVSALVASVRPDAGGPLRYETLADEPAEAQFGAREQILDICREAFGREGHSRHYTDPVLTGRLPGLSYTLAVMQLNFERLTPADFLVALDPGPGTICGFSVAEKKGGPSGNLYTQLLSAVRQAYRGRGVYQGLTELLRRLLPPDAALLNVTHADNRSMQGAYRLGGRVHLADTMILRRAGGGGGR